jgi:mitochondrial import receptor subunit TOM40
VGAPPYGPGLAGILPPRSEGEDKKEEKVDYLNLPCPVPFEEIQREALSLCPYPPF